MKVVAQDMVTGKIVKLSEDHEITFGSGPSRIMVQVGDRSLIVFARSQFSILPHDKGSIEIKPVRRAR